MAIDRRAIKEAISNGTTYLQEADPNWKKAYEAEHTWRSHVIHRKERPSQVCVKCFIRMPLESFNVRRHKNGRDYRDSACDICRKLSMLCRNHAISAEDYTARLEKNKEGCRICRRPWNSTRRPLLDHCHGTGQLRGFLCSACNAGIGTFNDDPDRLFAAVAYLEHWRKVHSEIPPTEADATRERNMSRMRWWPKKKAE